MRIIDQRRENSYELSRSELSVDENAIFLASNGSSNLIGEYRDYARAKEVFIELHEVYAKPVATCYEVGGEIDTLMLDLVAHTNSPILSKGDGELISANVMCENSVYYMPEE